MISSSLAFNDIEYLSKQLETYNSKAVFEYLSKFDTVLDYFHCIKQTIFSVSEFSGFQIDKGELALSSNEFLVDIPNYKIFTFNSKQLEFKLTYPRIIFGTYKQNIRTSIIDINNCNLSRSQIEQVLHTLPVKEYKELTNFVEDKIISKLNNIIIFNTKSQKHKKLFTYSPQELYKLLFYVCKYHLDYLRKIRIIMFKEGNFSHYEFNTMTVEEISKYYKLLKQMYDKPNE